MLPGCQYQSGRNLPSCLRRLDAGRRRPYPAVTMDTNQVTHYRELRKLTRGELAERTGVSYRHLTEIEHGRAVPSVLGALRIAKVLRTSVEKLFPLEAAA
jgi:DNA-binding XRE family transcriptional regulator